MSKSVIIQAINERKCLTLTYDGKNRLVEPHAFGVTKTGHLGLRCYQVDGDSATNPRAWKMLVYEKMEDLALANHPSAAPRAGYKMGDSALDPIYAQIELVPAPA